MKALELTEFGINNLREVTLPEPQVAAGQVLVQFDTLTPFFLIAIGLGAVQFIVGNVVEPAFMGKSLNLSAFMIILSLTFWGMVRGIPGMLLSVPIMVVTVIICARFESLRGIAIILSADAALLTTPAEGK